MRVETLNYFADSSISRVRASLFAVPKDLDVYIRYIHLYGCVNQFRFFSEKVRDSSDRGREAYISANSRVRGPPIDGLASR